MSLKYFVANLDEVGEAHKTLYKKSGDGFVLDVDGAVSDEDHATLNTKLAEFRDNNRTLNAKVKDFETRYKDIDPAAVAQLRTENEDLKKKVPTGPGGESIEVLIQRSVEAATSPIQKKFEAEEQRRQQAEQKLVQKDLEDRLWQVAESAGVRPEARDFWLAKAVPQFKVDGDQLVGVRLDADGKEQPLYSKRKGGAGNPLTAEEWALEIAPAEPSLALLYKGSGGGDGRNDPRRGSQTQNGVRILPNDPAVTSQNLEAIASGKAVVRTGA